jgi:hypothetical protein
MILSSKKARISLFVGLAILIVGLVAFAGLSSGSSKEKTSRLLVEYNGLIDSLSSTEQKIRSSSKPELISLHKDRLILFKSRIKKLRTELSSVLETKGELSTSNTDTQSASEEANAEMPQILYAVVGATAIVLLIAIIILVVLIKRKSAKTASPKPAAKENKIKFEFAPRNTGIDDLAHLDIPEPIAVEKQKSSPSTVANTSKEAQMKELEAFFAQKNEKDYSGDFGQTQELEALFPNVAETKPAVDDSLKELYPSTLKKMEKEDKEKSDILKLARRGYTSSDIARRLRLSQDQVELFLRMHRDKQ